MKNTIEKIFLYIAMVMLVFSFPWLAFFPMLACLEDKDNKQE